MKADEARKLSMESIQKQVEEQEAESKKRIDSGMYNGVFNEIKETAERGYYQVTVPRLRFDIIQIRKDLEYLGYQVEFLRSDGIDWVIIKWHTT